MLAVHYRTMRDTNHDEQVLVLLNDRYEVDREVMLSEVVRRESIF